MKRLFRLGFHLNEIQVRRNVYKKHVEWKDEGYPISFRELINESNIRHAMLNGIDDDQDFATNIFSSMINGRPAV